MDAVLTSNPIPLNDALLRHATYYLGLLGQASTRLAADAAGDVLQILDQEWSNVHQGLQWAAGNVDQSLEAAGLCAKYVLVAGKLLELRMSIPERLALTDSALRAAKRTDAKLFEAHHLQTLGNLCQQSRRLNEAMPALLSAKELFEQMENYAEVSECWLDIAQVGLLSGHTESALQIQLRAFELLQNFGTAQRQAEAMRLIGDTYRQLGQLEEASDWLKRARVVFESEGAKDDLGRVLGSIGNLYLMQGRFEQALEYYRPRLVVARELGDKMGEQIALGNLGIIQARLGNRSDAKEQFEEALRLALELGFEKGQGNAYQALANLEADVGHYSVAQKLYEKRLTLAREQLDVRAEATTLRNMSLLYAKLGQRDQAIAYVRTAISLYQSIGDPTAIAAREQLRVFESATS